MIDTSSLRAMLDRLLDERVATAALDEGTRDRLVAFIELLVKWNRVWNLTAVRDPLVMLERHVVDSLSLLPFVDAALLERGESCPAGAFDLADIGSGAGLPVLPLAIARPQLRCLSVERTGKKARFQQQAVLESGLAQVVVQAARIEDVQMRATIVTSRAFAAPGDFLALASRQVAPGGRALVMLGLAERLPAVLPAPFRLASLERIDGATQRHVAVCMADAPCSADRCD